jgi:hypothetical protein
MKKLLLTLSISIFYFQTQAQTPGIYGLAVKTSFSQTFLGKINTASGVVTNISGSSLWPNYVGALATINPFTNVYYYENGTNQFIGIDMVTGNTLTSPAMSNPSASFFDLVAFNCKDSAIYGMARATGPTRLYLAKINPVSGAVTNISASSIGNGFVSTPSTLDPVNKRFYFEDGSFLFTGVDMVTGNIVSSPALTYSSPNANLFDCFVYNCKDSVIYGLARKNSPGQMYLSKVNPITGLVTLISPTNINPNGQTSGGATIDQVNNIFYFQDGNQNLIGLSLATGTIVSSAAVTNTNANSFTNFRSNTLCNCGVVSTGITESFESSVNIYPNPTTKILNVDLGNAATSNIQVNLTDVSGKLIKTAIITAGQSKISFDLQTISEGIYFVKISNRKQNITRKIVVERE